MQPGRELFQIRRQGKADIFFFDLHFFEIREAFAAQVGDEFFH